MQNTSDNSTKPSTNQSKEEEKDHEGIGHAFFRSFDRSQPVGDIHQIHGEGIGQREVMTTLSDKDEASRLICGLTWGGEGARRSRAPARAAPICGRLLRTVIPAAAITALCWILRWKTSIPRADFEKKEHSYDEFI